MQVDDEDEAGAFEDDDLVVLVLPRDVGGVGAQPAVLGLAARERKDESRPLATMYKPPKTICF